MATVNHDPSCQCPRCRHSRRDTPQATPSTTPTIEKALNTGGSSSAASLIPLVVRVTGEEQDLIHEDPVAFIVVMKENDLSNQEIRNKLAAVLTEASRADLDGFFEQASVAYKEDRGGRSGRRITSGVAMIVAGGIITVPLAIFGGFFVIFGVILILAGLFQLGKGIYEARG